MRQELNFVKDYLDGFPASKILRFYFYDYLSIPHQDAVLHFAGCVKFQCQNDVQIILHLIAVSNMLYVYHIIM